MEETNIPQPYGGEDGWEKLKEYIPTFRRYRATSCRDVNVYKLPLLTLRRAPSAFTIATPFYAPSRPKKPGALTRSARLDLPDSRLPVVTQRSQQSARSVLSGIGSHDLGLGPDVPMTVRLEELFHSLPLLAAQSELLG